MFDSFLRDEVKRLGLPGLAVAITEQGQERFAAGYGECSLSGQDPITPDTPFGVASVTKLVTAISILQLQEQKALSINDPVARYFPDLHIAADTRMQLRHLLNHSSGLPGLSSRFFAVNRQNSGDASGGTELRDSADLVHFINETAGAPLAAPGTLLNYSNESFCLLGGVIEKLCGEPYKQRVKRSVFGPLNMAHTLVAHDASINEPLAAPLVREGAMLREAGIWDAPLFYPAGGVISSARDLNRLLTGLFHTKNLLSGDSLQVLRQSAVGVASRPDTSIGYACGLEYQSLDGDTLSGNSALHWHTGQRAGISSFVAWVSGPEIAISVLSHITDAPVAGIGFALVAKLLNRTDIVWPQLSDKLESRPITRLTGRYRSSEGFDFLVKAPGSTLFMTKADGSCQLPMRFFDDVSGIVGNQNFRFLHYEQASTQPWALALDLRILPLTDNS